MYSEDRSALARQLVEMRMEHHDLDASIMRISADPACNQLQLTRMKKRKLRLKQAIARLESLLIPDLDA